MIKEKLIFCRTYNIDYFKLDELDLIEWNVGWELINNTVEENK